MLKPRVENADARLITLHEFSIEPDLHEAAG
jgi:hypothetical protein